MAVTINVNGLTQCHLGSNGIVRATLPDICKTPTASNKPLPYPNIAYSADLANGTETVFADGGNSCAIKGSEFSKSIGDELGSGGGVKSGTYLDRATWLSWSPNVFLDGEAACRLSDKMLMNDGNTASLGGVNQSCLTDDEIEDILCEFACKCKGAKLKQVCVSEKIREKFYDGKYPKPDSQIWSEVSFKKVGETSFNVIMNKGGTAPTSNPYTPGGGIRPDCVANDGAGNITRIIEMKFPGDSLRPSQMPGGAYSQAANERGADYDVIDVTECKCWDDGEGPGQPVTAPAAQKEKEISWGSIAKGGLMVIGAGLAAVACVAGACEAIAAAAAATLLVQQVAQ